MRVYTVHVCGETLEPKDMVLVRESFCWPAFLFDVFWALYHRTWSALLVLATALCVVGGIGYWQLISTPILLLVLFGWRILVGFHGNDWRRTGLERRGFRMLDVVTGADDMSAARRFFDRITERS